MILYADAVTPSMRAAMDETGAAAASRIRLTKPTVLYPKRLSSRCTTFWRSAKAKRATAGSARKTVRSGAGEEIAKLEKQMREASKMLEFEYAAVLRDRIIALRGEEKKEMSPFLVLAFVVVIIGFVLLRPELLWRLWHKDKKAVLPWCTGSVAAPGRHRLHLLSVCLAQLV